jgi:hypothetical protein
MEGTTMIRAIEQLELGLRVKTLKEAVEASRARKQQCEQEEAGYLDMLARAEAEVTGKAPGHEGVELSGLIRENPYAAGTPPAAATKEGDAVDPASGKGAGGAPSGGKTS